MPTSEIDNVKINWLGGMNSQPDPTKISFENSYYLGVNIRTRANKCSPVQAPLDITDGLPLGGKIQGVYTFDRTLLAFVDGGAFYKLSETTGWVQVSGFAMSSTVDEIDCALVPASTVNFKRTALSTTTQTDNAVVLTNPINASPQVLICMDGETQPRVIFPDSTTRLVQTYAQWTQDNPEYVPIARFPLYANGILYCVGKDLAGNWTQIYHSVTGQPLNFVILVNKAGDKISGSEVEGGAPVLSWRASFSSTTAVSISGAAPGAFVLSTLNASWLVVPNYTSTIAAEPTADYTYLFDVGAVGKNSIVDVLGDTTIVCRSGVRSFNGISTLKWQGKNAPFSQPVNNFISAQEQTVTATISFDDYAFYALSTKYGAGILVYDFLQQAFVSIDIYNGVGLIKQFAKVQSGVSEVLYFYTTSNKIYKAFAGGNQRHQVVLADLIPDSVYGSHRVTEVNAEFTTTVTAGYAEAFVYSDRKYANTAACSLSPSDESFLTPGDLPFNEPLGADQCQLATFNYQTTNSNGYRATVGIGWDCNAELLNVRVGTVNEDSYTHGFVSLATPSQIVELIHVANDGVASNVRYDLNAAMQIDEPVCVIGSGNHASSPGANANIDTDIRPYWGVYHTAGKFVAAPGPNELQTVNGEPFYQYMQQGPNHYSVHSFCDGALRVFMLTSGYNASGTQVEPSNLDGPTVETSTQMQWLRRTLAENDQSFNVVCFYDTLGSSQPGVASRFTTIPFKSWGLDAILTGSGGLYERLVYSDGLVVINNGCGGVFPYNGPLAINDNSRVRVTGKNGYVRITISALRMTLQFVDTNGTIRDTTNL